MSFEGREDPGATQGEGNFVYPRWQVYGGRLLGGMQEILALLAEQNYSPIGRALYFLTERERYERQRPLDLLRYVRELKLPMPSLKAVLEEYLLAIDQAERRLANLDDLIEVQVRGWRMYPASSVWCHRTARRATRAGWEPSPNKAMRTRVG